MNLNQRKSEASASTQLKEKERDIESNWEIECPFCNAELKEEDIEKEAEMFVNEGALNDENEGEIDYECPECGSELKLEFDVEWIPEIKFRSVRWRE